MRSATPRGGRQHPHRHAITARQPPGFVQIVSESIALAIAEEISREVDYLEVENDGARKAAERIAELL